MKINFQCLAKNLLLSAALTVLSFDLRAMETLDADHIRKIAAMLPEHATGLGQPITNRTAWETLAVRYPELNNLIPSAVKLAVEPIPQQPDSLYLEFSTNGNRTRWQTVANSRRDRIRIFTLAECIENKGRFLAPLENTIAALCAERTWVLPAHDSGLKNYRGETVEIDLGSSMLGAELATASYLLGDRLPSGSQALIRENLERRIFAPYRAAINGARQEFWWMHGLNNWNAVCLDCVTGAALATIGPAEERAWFIAVAEKNINFYLSGGIMPDGDSAGLSEPVQTQRLHPAGGFTPDGYCVEGLGYWNYGFGHFTTLAENIRQSTGGKIDLLTKPLAAQPALFGLRSEIINGVYTSIADCNPGDGPSGILMKYLGLRFGLDSAPWRNAELTGGLYGQAAFAFLPVEMPIIHSENNQEDLRWRTWFPDGGVLICRPGTSTNVPFAVAIKGGNNGVSHGHHDVGSFSVVVGTNMVICDPGSEIYTSRTFSAHRYESKVLNSFGHTVPIIAGKLQQAGTGARAVVVHKEFTEAVDTLSLDVRSAYAAADLQKLERTFVFRRGQSPSLEVRDEVRYGTPEQFETALVSWGKFRRVSEYELEINDGEALVRVLIDTGGRAFHLKQETIDENVSSKRQPKRLGIGLDAKVSAATITLRIMPLVK